MGIDTPVIFFTDIPQGIIIMEKIDGVSVREFFLKDVAPWSRNIYFD